VFDFHNVHLAVLLVIGRFDPSSSVVICHLSVLHSKMISTGLFQILVEVDYEVQPHLGNDCILMLLRNILQNVTLTMYLCCNLVHQIC